MVTQELEGWKNKIGNPKEADITSTSREQKGKVGVSRIEELEVAMWNWCSYPWECGPTSAGTLRGWFKVKFEMLKEAGHWYKLPLLGWGAPV